MSKVNIITCDLVSMEDALNRIGAENIISVVHREIVGVKPLFLIIYKETLNDKHNN